MSAAEIYRFLADTQVKNGKVCIPRTSSVSPNTSSSPVNSCIYYEIYGSGKHKLLLISGNFRFAL